MSKRKRDDEADDEGAAAPNFRRQRQIMAAFAQGAHDLEKAFKLARGFERQKLGRRKKTALAVKASLSRAAEAKAEAENARIDAEVAALKTLDLANSAQHFLAKSLLKIKAVQAAPDLPPEIGTPKPIPAGTAARNVHARLCNSNPVKSTLPKAAAHVKREFGIDDGVSVKKRRVRATDDVEKGQAAESDQEMLAATDEDSNDSDGSHVNVEDLERQLAQEGIARRQRQQHDSDRTGSDSEVEAGDRSQKERKKPNMPKKLFLPTLTMTGYVSGSGSDLDDDLGDDKPKKNRRGQRARQAIWEMRYGKKAKHVQEQELKSGWDPKRGAVGDAKRPTPSSSRFAKDANKLPLGKQRGGFAPGADPAEVPKKMKRDDTGPLHPSWEAAKRAKEKKNVPVAFQGKKISFD